MRTCHVALHRQPRGPAPLCRRLPRARYLGRGPPLQSTLYLSVCLSVYLLSYLFVSGRPNLSEEAGVHNGSQVPSPTHVGKSLNMDGGELLTFEPIEIWFIMINNGFWFFYIKYIHWDLCWELSLVFLLDPTLNSGPDRASPLNKSCCHVGVHVILMTWDLGTPCEVVSPNFLALNG